MKVKQLTIGIIFTFILTLPLLSVTNVVLAEDFSPKYIHLTWQNDPKTTQTISWFTTDTTDSVVQYGIDDTYGSEANSIESKWHHVELTDLSSDTTYHYRVGDGSTWSGDYYFQTGTTENHISFLGYGDSQSETTARKEVIKALERIESDFTLYSGDFVETARTISQWYGWFSSFHKITPYTSVMTALGNHEKNHSLYYQLFALPGVEEYYSFDYGPIHVSVLNTYYEGFEDAGGDYENQAAWLIEDLEANQDAKWKIVMMHRPPFSSYPRNFESSNWYHLINSTFVPIFENYSIDLVMHGHEHGYERMEKNGVNYIISAGAGSNLYYFINPINESVYSEASYNFVFYEVNDNKLHAKAYKPDYTLFDQLIINKQDKVDLSFVTLPLTYKEYWEEGTFLELPVTIANTGEQNITETTELSLTILEEPSAFRDYVPEPIVTTYDIPPLDVGENYTIPFNWTIEVQTDYHYSFSLDSTELLDEVTESNNDLKINFVSRDDPDGSSFIAEGVTGFILVLSFLLVPTIIRKRRKRI